MQQEVIVGNIGTVYDGESVSEARLTYQHYRRQSLQQEGRAAGESVTWISSGEVRGETLEGTSVWR
jgi:hypothetical protein